MAIGGALEQGVKTWRVRVGRWPDYNAFALMKGEENLRGQFDPCIHCNQVINTHDGLRKFVEALSRSNLTCELLLWRNLRRRCVTGRGVL